MTLLYLKLQEAPYIAKFVPKQFLTDESGEALKSSRYSNNLSSKLMR